MKTKTPTRADLAKGRAAFKNIVDSASTIFALIDKYGKDILGSLDEGQLEGAQKLIQSALKLQAESFDEMINTLVGLPKTLERLTYPVAPPKKPCSFYCAPSRGEPRGCVYCGHPKSKHTKAAQNKQREYAPKGRTHV